MNTEDQSTATTATAHVLKLVERAGSTTNCDEAAQFAHAAQAAASALHCLADKDQRDVASELRTYIDHLQSELDAAERHREQAVENAYKAEYSAAISEGQDEPVDPDGFNLDHIKPDPVSQDQITAAYSQGWQDCAMTNPRMISNAEQEAYKKGRDEGYAQGVRDSGTSEPQETDHFEDAMRYGTGAMRTTADEDGNVVREKIPAIEFMTARNKGALEKRINHHFDARFKSEDIRYTNAEKENVHNRIMTPKEFFSQQ